MTAVLPVRILFQQSPKGSTSGTDHYYLSYFHLKIVIVVVVVVDKRTLLTCVKFKNKFNDKLQCH